MKTIPVADSLDWDLIVHSLDLPLEARALACCCHLDEVTEGRIGLLIRSRDMKLLNTAAHRELANGMRGFMDNGPAVALAITIIKG